MWKTLGSTSLLAILLTSLSTNALADHRDRGKHWDAHRGGWNNSHQRLPTAHRRAQWRYLNRNSYDPWRFGRPGIHRGFYGPGWGTFGSGALLGTALTYSIVHDHDRRRDCFYEDRRAHREIRGCYRVERLSGGHERRVALPASACR